MAIDDDTTMPKRLDTPMELVTILIRDTTSPVVVNASPREARNFANQYAEYLSKGLHGKFKFVFGAKESVTTTLLLDLSQVSAVLITTSNLNSTEVIAEESTV